MKARVDVNGLNFSLVLMDNMSLLLKILLLILFSPAVSMATDVIELGSFSSSGLSGWSEKSFQGTTEYRIVEEGGEKVLYAKSEKAASGLVFETDYDPQQFPILSWRWKISEIVSKGDSRSKSGDDYAARIYVIFPHWFFPKTKTLNYIWGNQLPKDSFQRNVYTSNAMMIAVESGSAKAGEWVTVRRNLLDDYRKAFGEEPSRVGAIAIMTDTDNTGESAEAWYGDIKALRK
jgi:hypothetical protein